jgi:hypothetical protein
VDSTAGCETLCFLDTNSVFHQIAMDDTDDQLATTFITPFSYFCYSSMPFGLKNAGVTFQRCMQHVFCELIWQLVEAYVDDIVVKSRRIEDLVPDLTVVLEKLRKFQVRLNPEKCIFGVPRGMLLGFVVSECNIEANPEKITAITSMGPIQNIKAVQLVTGCLAALNQFIARLGERSLPLYQLLKKSEHFTWTSEVQEALESLKKSLEKPPVLTMPAPVEPMLLYIATTTQVVSAALVVVRDESHKVLKVY